MDFFLFINVYLIGVQPSVKKMPNKIIHPPKKKKEKANQIIKYNGYLYASIK